MVEHDKQHPLRTNCPICPKEGKPRRKYRDFWGHIRTEHGLSPEQFRKNPEYQSIKVHESETHAESQPVLTQSTSPKPRPKTESHEVVLTLSPEDIRAVSAIELPRTIYPRRIPRLVPRAGQKIDTVIRHLERVGEGIQRYSQRAYRIIQRTLQALEKEACYVPRRSYTGKTARTL